MIPTGEMLIGVALVLGLLTRAALISALALVLNYHLTNGSLFTPAFFSNPYALVILSCLLFLLASKAGSVFAVDGSARKKTSEVNHRHRSIPGSGADKKNYFPVVSFDIPAAALINTPHTKNRRMK